MRADGFTYMPASFVCCRIARAHTHRCNTRSTAVKQLIRFDDSILRGNRETSMGESCLLLQRTCGVFRKVGKTKFG